MSRQGRYKILFSVNTVDSISNLSYFNICSILYLAKMQCHLILTCVIMLICQTVHSRRSECDDAIKKKKEISTAGHKSAKVKKYHSQKLCEGFGEVFGVRCKVISRAAKVTVQFGRWSQTTASEQRRYRNLIYFALRTALDTQKCWTLLFNTEVKCNTETILVRSRI